MVVYIGTTCSCTDHSGPSYLCILSGGIYYILSHVLHRGIDLDGGVTGIAFLRTMCSNTHSVGVTKDRGRAISSVGRTAAHELGHILNMGHDGSEWYTFIHIVKEHDGLGVYKNILFKYTVV